MNIGDQFGIVLGSVLAKGFQIPSAPLFRIPVEPNEHNGLRAPSRLMVDKIVTVPKSKIGERVGRLDDEDLVRLNRAAMVFLGLAVSPRLRR